MGLKDDSFEAESNFEQYNIRNGLCDREQELQVHPRVSNNEHENCSSDNEKDTCLSEPVSKTELMLCTLLFNRISLILLAGIVNVLLVLKLDHLFGQVIFIIFNEFIEIFTLIIYICANSYRQLSYLICH